MALVAYDNSDSSEYEDDEDTSCKIYKNPKDKETRHNIEKAIDSAKQLHSERMPNLFNLLPQPSTKKLAVVEEEDEFLHKKEKLSNAAKPKAKITVPSLSDFKDVERPAPALKPKATSGKKSGLLGMLPHPKNGLTSIVTTKSFVPHVLTQSSGTKKKIPSPKNKIKNDKLIILNGYSDESDNDEIENDFFSFNKTVEVPVIDISLDHNEIDSVTLRTEPERSKLETYFKKDPVEKQIEMSEPVEIYDQYDMSEASISSKRQMETEHANEDNVLDEEAILKLCGARGKRRREEIQIVDVNQQEVLADAEEWLLKGLMDDTSKRLPASKRKGNEPTSQQKRKHQITYLAHQAKANEADLQNQWANSRMSRRQTQNKYGF